DSNSHHFIFSGGVNNNWKLFSVDTQTGQVISNPVFPVLSDPNDNLIELQFDNTSNILYGLHWDNYYSNTVGNKPPQSDFVFNAYPNPFTEKCTIELDNPYQEITVLLYDENGRIVSKQVGANTSSIIISRENLPKGFYQATIIGDHILLGTTKINVL
ncbi:MAG: T9SS type A sorting domain-containing protein, partial [Bacteroidetes bacterium]|nr:T9SS type A sorting domain-containing protein [Bacteroidota bacterium]